MTFDANDEHTKKLIDTIAEQRRLLELEDDTLTAIAAQQGPQFVKKLVEECYEYIQDGRHNRWRNEDGTLDWDNFVYDVELIAKLPTGPEQIFDAIMPFDDGLHWYMADMNAEDFKKHATILDDLVLFMACQQYKQKGQQGVGWCGDRWAACLKQTQEWFATDCLPVGKGHGDWKLWASLFERSLKLLSE